MLRKGKGAGEVYNCRGVVGGKGTTVHELKQILIPLDDDMEVLAQVTDENYKVKVHKIDGYNSYDGDTLKLEVELV